MGAAFLVTISQLTNEHSKVLGDQNTITEFGMLQASPCHSRGFEEPAEYDDPSIIAL